MRTKTLFLTAAALAAGFATSMAQSNVYSVNVVGYVNLTAGGSEFTMMANPLNTATNTLGGLFPSVPGGTTLQVWNGAGFDGYTFTLGHWRQGSVVSDSVMLPPGKGFFLHPSSSGPITNTIVGQVTAETGASVTNSIDPGLQAVGSLIPYSGAITNESINLTVPGGTTFQQWNIANQSFDGYSFTLGKWRQGSTVITPSISVGEGFFLNTSGGLDWVQTLPSN